MAKITYENKTFINKNENIADINKVNDSDLNQIKEVVNENDDAFESFKNNIVFEKTLDVATSSIVVDSLDIVADGGEYEFELLASTSSEAELEIQIDNFINSYFNIINRVSDSTDGSHDITPVGRYEPNANCIKGWLYLVNSASNSYFSITQGKLWCINNKTNYHIEHSEALRARHSLVNLGGLIGVANENINSLTFRTNNGVNFNVGTKIIIRKRR